MKKQTIAGRLHEFFWRLRAASNLRQLEKELDRRAARILTKEEQRAEREAWTREAMEL